MPSSTRYGSDAGDLALARFKWPERNPVRWLLFSGILLVVVIGVGTGLVADHFRHRAIESSKQTLGNSALLISRHFDQQLDDLLGVQGDTIAYMRDEGVLTVDAFRGHMSTLGIHQMLRTKMKSLPYVGGINLFDSDGWLINSSETWPVPSINVADRSHFKRLSSDDGGGIVVEPVISRVTGAWTAVFAQRVVGPDGRFLGMISRGVEPSYFEQFLGSLSLESQSSILMVHEDGQVLARYPNDGDAIGSHIGEKAPFTDMLRRRDAVAGEFASPKDGQSIVVSARRLTNFPIYIASTISRSAALAEWRTQTNYLIVGATVCAVFVAAILFFIIRQLNRHHQAAHDQLDRKSQHLDLAVNNIAQGLVLFDAAGRMVFCNSRYLEMFGLSPDVVKPGCHLRELVAHRKVTGSFVGDIDHYCDAFMKRVAAGTVNDAVLTTPDGRSVQIVYRRASDGGWVSTLEDITERRNAQTRVAHLAQFDALTDLPNRTSFREHVERSLADASDDERIAVLYIDIDQFKGINDTFGHAVGDALLVEVAARLRGSLRNGDFVARLGGDEFAVVQASVRSRNDVEQLVARLYRSLREEFDCVGHPLSADASIGIAMAPQDGSTLDGLLKRADMAMYQAKWEGRRRHRFFDIGMEHQVNERRLFIRDLGLAIQNDELEVHYQPIVDLDGGEVSGCEALLRWRHPRRGMVSPEKFIAVAEKNGLIEGIGEWVIRTACAEAAKWPGRLTVAVNVSPVQLDSPTFVLNVLSALADANLTPDRLELEITEAVLIRDGETTLRILHELRGIGIRIALDDFGTGYSSLSYLRRFPFDKIKIDRTFIDDICSSRGSSAIVQAVLNIAAALDMTTTAEGVETEEQRRLLGKLGCSQMQGYLYSPAVSATELKPILGSSGRTVFVQIESVG